MMAEHTVREKMWRRAVRVLASARLRALLSLGMVLGLGVVGTMAAWSTSATATSGEFTTGTVDIKLNGSDGVVTQPYVFTTGPVLPGKSVAQVIAVQNTGSLPFRFDVTAYGAGTLLPSLSITARAGGAVSNGACTGGTPQSTVSQIPASPGASPNLSTALGAVAATTGVTNYCVQVNLSLAAPSNLQGTTADVTLLFTATGVSSA